MLSSHSPVLVCRLLLSDVGGKEDTENMYLDSIVIFLLTKPLDYKPDVEPCSLWLTHLAVSGSQQSTIA